MAAAGLVVAASLAFGVGLAGVGFGAAGFVVAGVAGARTGVTAASAAVNFAAVSGLGITSGAGLGDEIALCFAGEVDCSVDSGGTAVSGGKTTLGLLDDAWTPAVASSGTGFGAEPSTFEAGLPGFRRRRPAEGLPFWGGFAILGFTPLFRHINEIRDLAAILPSA